MKTSNTPTAYVIGAALVVIVLAYIAGRWLGKNKPGENDTTEKAKKEVNPSRLSYSQSQFSAFADKIYQAIQYFYTDEGSIFETVKMMKNRDDVLQLIISFGNREAPTFLGIFGGGKYNLPEYLTANMSRYGVEKVNKILSENKINYTL